VQVSFFTAFRIILLFVPTFGTYVEQVIGGIVLTATKGEFYKTTNVDYEWDSKKNRVDPTHTSHIGLISFDHLRLRPQQPVLDMH
jgi:hypothetical protein